MTPLLAAWASDIAALCGAGLREEVVLVVDPPTAPRFADSLLRRVGLRSRGPVALRVELADLRVELDERCAELHAYVLRRAHRDAREAAANGGCLVVVAADRAATVYRWTPREVVAVDDRGRREGGVSAARERSLGPAEPEAPSPANDPGLSERDVERIAQRVLALLVPLISRSSDAPKYADKERNPYGKPRAFLDAARRGDFATFRRCRRLTALWPDVEAAIERRRTAKAALAPLAPAVDIDQLLAGARPRKRAA